MSWPARPLVELAILLVFLSAAVGVAWAAFRATTSSGRAAFMSRLRIPLLGLLIAATTGCGPVLTRSPRPGATQKLTAAERSDSFHYVNVAPADRQAIAAAIALGRPDARRLVHAIDGLVDLRVASTGTAQAIGTTASGGQLGDRYLVTLDLATVMHQLGQRGVVRVVWHELGHVVDSALVSPELNARLDASIPRGWGCDDGQTGACAPPEERFAESFAKWATGDLGVNLYAGYKVPPPEPSVETWGAPLAALHP